MMIDRTPKEQISDRMTQEIQAARAARKTLEQMAQEARVEQAAVELVQDRKTGLYYNPQEAFDAMMNKPEILAMLKRLAVR
jgi:hypothetical protein